MTSDVFLSLLIGFAVGVLEMYFVDKKQIEKSFEEGIKVGLALNYFSECLSKCGTEADDGDC